jgi:hypothetical protein
LDRLTAYKNMAVLFFVSLQTITEDPAAVIDIGQDGPGRIPSLRARGEATRFPPPDWIAAAREPSVETGRAHAEETRRRK